jgi:hypothetical protein
VLDLAGKIRAARATVEAPIVINPKQVNAPRFVIG